MGETAGNNDKVNQQGELSKRELEMLKEIANGLSSQQLSEKYFISLDTVETHRKNIIKKLDAENMMHAVAIAIRKKIIE